jgi:hypothetical protein
MGPVWTEAKFVRPHGVMLRAGYESVCPVIWSTIHRCARGRFQVLSSSCSYVRVCLAGSDSLICVPTEYSRLAFLTGSYVPQTRSVCNERNIPLNVFALSFVHPLVMDFR